MSTERPLPNDMATGIIKALELKSHVKTLESLLREAEALITHAGELHRPATAGGGNFSGTELLVTEKYLTRRKAWLERAVKELGPEWGENTRAEEVTK